MAKIEGPSKQVNRKHLARQEKERRQTRTIFIATIAVLAVVLGLLAFVLIDTYLVKPSVVLASVGDTDITVKEYQPEVKYTRLNQINQANQYYYYAQIFGEMGGNFLTTAQNLVTNLSNPTLLGNQVLNGMIEDILIQEEADKRGITVSQAEIDQAIMEAFEFFPNGTPTPAATATAVTTPTMSLTQIAIIQPTETATALPSATATPRGWQPSSTATQTLEPTVAVPADSTPTSVPTATTEPSITPTPTTYTTKVFGQNMKEYYGTVDAYNITRADVNTIFRAQLLRDKLAAAITADLKPVEAQVWARHILVATEDEANTVLKALEDGEDWSMLAATYSTDTSNKDNGGDLGWFGAGRMVKEFEEAAFALEIGEISQPVKTQFGYHIIQLVDKGDIDLNESDFEFLKSQTFTNWLDEQRSARTDIVINDLWTEYTPDTPAVPSQLLQGVFGGA